MANSQVPQKRRVIRVLWVLVACFVGTTLVLSGCNNRVDRDDDGGNSTYPSGSVNGFSSAVTTEAIITKPTDKSESIDKSAFKETLDAIEDFIDGYPKTTRDIAPPEYWDYLLNRGISREEIKEQIQARPEKATLYFYYYEPTNVDALSSADWEGIRNILQDTYGIDKQSVTEGYAVKLCQTTAFMTYIEAAEAYSDDVQSYDTDVDVIAVKINDTWYMVSESGDFLWFDPRQSK